MEKRKNFLIGVILEMIVIFSLCFANSDTLQKIDSPNDYTLKNLNFVSKEDSVASSDSLSQISLSEQKEKKTKSRIVKHSFDYRQQIVLSLTMMAFLALLITSTGAWNPK